VSQFGDLCSPERLDVAILLLADSHDCFLDFDLLDVVHSGPAYIGLLVPLIFDFFLLCAHGTTPVYKSAVLRPFALCAPHHTRVQSSSMYRCSFAHGTSALSRLSPPRSSYCCFPLSASSLQTLFSRNAVTTRIRCEFSNWRASVQLLLTLFVQRNLSPHKSRSNIKVMMIVFFRFSFTMNSIHPEKRQVRNILGIP